MLPLLWHEARDCRTAGATKRNLDQALRVSVGVEKHDRNALEVRQSRDGKIQRNGQRGVPDRHIAETRSVLAYAQGADSLVMAEYLCCCVGKLLYGALEFDAHATTSLRTS